MAAKEALLDEKTEHARRLDEMQAVHRGERAAALVPCTTKKGGPAAMAHSSGVGSPVGDVGKDDIDGGGEDLKAKDPHPEQEVHELIVCYPAPMVWELGLPVLEQIKYPLR